MRKLTKILIATAIFFTSTIPAWGQTPITVTATITDPNGLPYSNANVQAQLIPTGGTPTIIVGGIPTAIGGQQNATTDVNGTFRMNMFCNQSGNGCSVITAGGANNTQWQFTVQETGIQAPAGTGPQTFSVTVTLSGGSGLSQSLSTTLSAAAPALSRLGGTTGSGASPIMGLYLASNCPTANTGNCIFTFADTQQADSCSWSNASTTLTCFGFSLLGTASVTANVATYTSIASFPSTWVAGNSVTITGYSGGDTFFSQTCTIATITTTAITCPLVHGNATAGQTTAQIVNNSVGPFVSSDVGKSAMGGGTCATDQYDTAYGNVISSSALVTITGFISSTQITISATPANSKSQTAAYPAGGCFIWGHPDDAGFANLWTAAASALTCPKIFLAASYYLVTTPPQILWGNPYACPQTAPGVNGGFGNTTLPGGMEVEGRGIVATTIFLASSFPSSDTGTHLASSASSYFNGLVHSGGFFALPLMGKWQDFSISGGYQASAANLNSKTLITGTVATLQNFGTYNYGAFTGGNSICLETSFLVNLVLWNNAGCGGIGWWQDQNTNGTFGNRVIVENSSIASLIVANGAGGQTTASGVVCYNCVFALSNNQPLGALPNIQNNGGALRLYGGRAGMGNGAQPSLITGVADYRAGAANSYLYSDGFTFEANGGTNNTAIQCVTGACTNHLVATSLLAAGTGNTYNDVAGSLLADLGGNTLSGGAGAVVNGAVVGDASITGTTITAAKLVLSGGWGTTAAWTALTGETRLVQGTITASGTGQAANPTITYTFPTPFFAISNLICSATQVGGTQTAVANPFVPSALSATAVTFTYQGTPGAGNTLVVQINCGVK